MATLDNNIHLPRGVNDFEDGEIYCFRSDFERRKGKAQEELQKEIEGGEYTISTYGDILGNGQKRMRNWKKEATIKRAN